ncbi:MAG: hypothetical protein R2879_05920 [Saprospiraceae bacterium]
MNFRLFKNGFILALFTSVLISACGGNGTGTGNPGDSAPDQVSDNNSKKEKDPEAGMTVVSMDNEKMTMKDGSTLEFPKPEEKKTVMFILPPGDFYLEDRSISMRLSDDGLAHANMLGMFFSKVQLGGVLASMTPYTTQTAQPVAQLQNTTVFNFNNVDYGPFLDYVYNTKLGEKFVIVEDAIKIPDLLYTLTGGRYQPAELPRDEHRTMYVVFSEARAFGQVSKVKF